MKKVVLLAGAIAAGMAVAPQAANAAAPETNDIQEVNRTDQEVSAVITKANTQIDVLEGIKATTGYAAVVDPADQTAINTAINDLKALVTEMTYIIDNNIGTNSDYFRNANAVWPGTYEQGDLKVDPSAAGTPDYIKRYAGGTLNTCEDVVDAAIAAVAPNVTAAQAALAAHLSTMSPADILDANATTAGNVDKTALETILEEALDILGAYDTNYQDPAGDKSDIYDATIYGGKDGAINTKFDATVKGQIEAAKQLLERIEAAKNKDLTVDDTLDDQLLNQFELQTDVNVLTPLLEGYVVTFKIEANHVAAAELPAVLASDFVLNHHQNCKHTATHNITDEIQNTIDNLDPDADWDAETDLHVRANSNPLAVRAYEAHLNGTSIPEVSSLYKKALGWDVTDLAEAIDAFQDRFNALDDCDVKTSIGTFLWSGTAIAGTVAKEFNDLKTEIMALGTTVTPAEFKALDQRVTNLYERLANVEKAWDALAQLNADDAALQKEITDAAGKDGYTSTAIKNKWETEEQPELDNLEKDINDALIAITKDAEFVGYNHFKPTVELEKDHHKWLADYQKANYDAAYDLRVAINLRSMELNNVENYKFASNENQETTDDNLNVAFKDIKGEKDTSKLIYMEKYFNELDAHIGNNNSTLEGTDAVKHGDDLRYDRVNDWYDKGLAEYIGATTYAAGWAEAAHAGKKIENTTPGVETVVSTETTVKADVIFGWLQTEIHNAYKGIVENEHANKVLHDQIDACEDYVKDAKDDIDNFAKVDVSMAAHDEVVYNMVTRLDETTHQVLKNGKNDIKWAGNYVGYGTYADSQMQESWKTNPEPLADYVLGGVVSYNYKNDFTCAHDTKVLGWDTIALEITKLWNKEKEEYDKVASKALLDSGDVEEKITELEENVDDIKNEAYSRVIASALTWVNYRFHDARIWAKGIDDQCHEKKTSHKCDALDVQNNPCGWDEPAAKAAYEKIIDDYTALFNEYKAAHNDELNDDHETPVIATDKIKYFETAVNQLAADILTWKGLFAAADKAHKIKLNEALDQVEEEAHTLHHYAEDANHDAASFTAADKAVADLWAQDFNLRLNDTSLFDEEGNQVFKGEKITFQAFMDRLLKAVGHTGVHPNPDKLANAEKVATNGIKNFEDYIEAMDCIEDLLIAFAQDPYKKHNYTELKNLAQGIENFNWESDYMKAINANNAAHVELLKQHAQAQATLDAAKNDVIADKNEVYPVDYTTLTTTALKEAQDVLDAQKTNIEKAWKEGKAADYSADGTEDLEVKGYALDITKDGKNVIDAYVAKAQAAKDLYAANKVAKEELLVQIQAILTNTNSAYEEVECAETAGCTQDFRTDLDNLKKALVGENGDGGIKKEVNDGFAAKFADKTAAQLKAEVDALETKLGQVKKDIAEFNHKVLASADAKADILDKIEKAFGTEGSLMKPALAETGAENFKHVPAAGEVRNTAKYFDEINAEIDDLKTTITNDDSHAGNHSALEKYNTYLQTLAGIKADLEELVQAIKDNEQAHKDQLQHRDELYKKYECYDTTGLEAAVNGIADPDFSLDTEFPEVPGYPETAVDPAGNDHTKAHTAVAEAIKALDAEIKKHYENGASNMDDAKTLIGEKETEYTTAFEHAQTNDSKFMTEYGKCTEAALAVKYTYENWQADHFENGANKYSDEADVQVTKAYNEMVAAQKAYLADIKTDWYKNEAVEKVANNEGLLTTYKEKINAYNAAVEKAQTNDQEFDKQLAAHVVKPLTAEATYTDTRVVADPVYVTLKAQLTALYPECNNVETDSKYNTIRKQIIQDWEDEKSALNGTAEAVAAYQAAAKKYNELMDNLNAYGSQLVKYLQQSDAFNEAKTTIAGYDIMTPDYKDFDGNTEGAEDYNHKKDIENAIDDIDGKLDTLYSDMKTEAEHVAETINDADLTNNEVNDLNVAPAVGTIKTLIENLVKDAKKYEDACDANEAAFEPLHDNIKAVEADYAEDSAKVTALPEPAQEAFILAVKEDLEALAQLQKDLEEAYMDEDAVNFTKDNTDYEDLKKEIEEMYDRAVQAGANLGDIDGINGVTVYDSDALVDIVLYNRGYAVRGDFDFNGENDVTDVERLNNLLWYKHIEKAWAPGRVAFEGDIELTAEGNTVALALNNNVKTNGIQFDITVPEGAYIQNVLGTDRVQGMRVLSACIADNTYRVLVISTLNASTINDNEGAIVTFNVCGGNEVEVSNVIATDGNSHRLNGAAVSVGVTTDIQEIATEGETDIFSLDGIRQSVMKAGVNIVRGANGVAKKIFNK